MNHARCLAAGWLSTMLSFTPAALGLSIVGMPAPIKTDAQRSCYELSAEITQLTRVQSGTAGFWNQADNQAASVMTIVAAIPALAYLGYNAYEGFKQDQVAQAADARVQALRHQLAAKQCFVR